MGPRQDPSRSGASARRPGWAEEGEVGSDPCDAGTAKSWIVGPPGLSPAGRRPARNSSGIRSARLPAGGPNATVRDSTKALSFRSRPGPCRRGGYRKLWCRDSRWLGRRRRGRGRSRDRKADHVVRHLRGDGGSDDRHHSGDHDSSAGPLHHGRRGELSARSARKSAAVDGLTRRSTSPDPGGPAVDLTPIPVVQQLTSPRSWSSPP
jgi:hypothetical protein